MDAELPIWRRCFLGKVFEQWHNQVLGISVGWFSVHWFSVSRQIEIGVENETNDESTYVERAARMDRRLDESTYVEIGSEECEEPNTVDGF